MGLNKSSNFDPSIQKSLSMLSLFKISNTLFLIKQRIHSFLVSVKELLFTERVVLERLCFCVMLRYLDDYLEPPDSVFGAKHLTVICLINDFSHEDQNVLPPWTIWSTPFLSLPFLSLCL